MARTKKSNTLEFIPKTDYKLIPSKNKNRLLLIFEDGTCVCFTEAQLLQALRWLSIGREKQTKKVA